MEESIFEIEPGTVSLSNLTIPAFVIVETLPNGNQARHRMNEAGNPFRTEAEAQLWIIKTKAARRSEKPVQKHEAI